MDVGEIEAILTDVFRTLFRRPDLELRDDLTAKQVPGWDSLNHVNLIIQIEEELGIKFRNDEVARLANVGELKRLVHEKVAQAAS
jgi:acyl carrier protein